MKRHCASNTKYKLSIIAGLLLLAFQNCGTTKVDVAAAEVKEIARQQREKWEQTKAKLFSLENVQQYTIKVNLDCFCSENSITTLVQLQKTNSGSVNEEIISILSAGREGDLTRPTDSIPIEHAISMSDLFDRIEGANLEQTGVTVTYRDDGGIQTLSMTVLDGTVMDGDVTYTVDYIVFDNLVICPLDKLEEK